MLPNPVIYSINSLADVSKDIPDSVAELSFLVMSSILVIVFAFAKNLEYSQEGGSIACRILLPDFVLYCNLSCRHRGL